MTKVDANDLVAWLISGTRKCDRCGRTITFVGSQAAGDTGVVCWPGCPEAPR